MFVGFDFLFGFWGFCGFWWWVFLVSFLGVLFVWEFFGSFLVLEVYFLPYAMTNIKS